MGYSLQEQELIKIFKQKLKANKTFLDDYINLYRKTFDLNLSDKESDCVNYKEHVCEVIRKVELNEKMQDELETSFYFTMLFFVSGYSLANTEDF